MNRKRIVVVDSGIELSSERLRNNCIEPKSFLLSEDKKIIESNDCVDINGHGTAVAYTILKKNKEDLIIPIKVTNNQGKTSSRCLIKALEYLIDVDVDIINISLATTMFSYEDDFRKVCDELVRRKKYIVASMDNLFRESLPAFLPSVIGVRGENLSNTNSYWYNEKYSIQCVCDEEPIFVPGVDGNKYQLFLNNSKAAAVMTSNISDILKKHDILNYNELQYILTKTAEKNSWDIKDAGVNLRNMKLMKEKCEDFEDKYIKIHEIIRENFNPELDINYMLDNPTMAIKTGINRRNIADFLYLVEDKFNIDLDYDSISFKNFSSVYELLKLV